MTAPPAPPAAAPPPPAAVPPPAASISAIKRSNPWLVGWMVLAEVAVVLLVGVLTRQGVSLAAIWGVVAAGMVAFVLVLGGATLGTPWGVLISNRNVMSLSRFQLTLWTLLVCSAFVTVAVARVFSNNVADPLAIQLPAQLWQLLGISATSTIGASLVLQNKTNKEPASAAITQRLSDQTNDTPATIDHNRQGIAYANTDPSAASFSDMFEGDELGNTAYIDISKVQMFFFTLIAVVGYAANLYDVMIKIAPAALNSFPVLSPGLVAILGISHVAYLGNKAVDHTKTT